MYTYIHVCKLFPFSSLKPALPYEALDYMPFIKTTLYIRHSSLRSVSLDALLKSASLTLFFKKIRKFLVEISGGSVAVWGLRDPGPSSGPRIPRVPKLRRLLCRLLDSLEATPRRSAYLLHAFSKSNPNLFPFFQLCLGHNTRFWRPRPNDSS